MKIRSSDKRPVLLLGWVPRIVVPVARSLHRHGIPVDVANFTSQHRIASRAIREFVCLPHPEVDPVSFRSEISNLVRQRGYDMLVPTDDQALVALTENYQELSRLTRLACPPPETVGLVLNKTETLELARECGIRVPGTKLISNSGELHGLIGNLTFPWVLKPSAKETRVEESKSLILLSEKEVAIAFPVPRNFSPPMLLQEFCAGVGVGVEILLHNGEAKAIFQHRRLQEFPYKGGFSVTAIAEKPDSTLVEKSLALLRAMRWEGPAMVEFKVNPVDGGAVLMEVNGRYWGSISLAIACGVDFPLFHWQLEHGEAPLIPEKYAVGTKWRWTAGHIYRLHALLVDAMRSRVARKALLTSLLTLPGVLSPTVRDALFTVSDPLPAARDLMGALKIAWNYDVQAILRRLPLSLVHSSAK